jgi:hypothetical protein
MTGELNLLQLTLGALSLLVGLGVMIAALRRRGENEPRATAMLIFGMMAAAFGLLIAGFAIALATGENPR